MHTVGRQPRRDLFVPLSSESDAFSLFDYYARDATKGTRNDGRAQRRQSPTDTTAKPQLTRPRSFDRHDHSIDTPRPTRRLSPDRDHDDNNRRPKDWKSMPMLTYLSERQRIFSPRSSLITTVDEHQKLGTETKRGWADRTGRGGC